LFHCTIVACGRLFILALVSFKGVCRRPGVCGLCGKQNAPLVIAEYLRSKMV